MCVKVTKAEKIRIQEEEDGKGQEGNKMKERGRGERKKDGKPRWGKEEKVKKNKLSYSALMSSGKKWDTVATHTVTLQFSAPRKRGN